MIPIKTVAKSSPVLAGPNLGLTGAGLLAAIGGRFWIQYMSSRQLAHARISSLSSKREGPGRAGSKDHCMIA